MSNVLVLGAGSWGTALAALLRWNGHNVTLWAHRSDEAELLRKTGRNESKLPGINLPEGIIYTSDLSQALNNKDLVVLAVPSSAERETCEKIKPYWEKGRRIITVSKGIESDTLMTQCDIIEDVLPGSELGILSGPSHAEEVIRHMPTLVVAGSESRELAMYVQELFMNENFRVYTSPDVIGIEIGGSLKNVIALAAGMSDGLGFGDNAKAALITRGIREISALACKMGAMKETLSGLTGIGDLIVTCQSVHSRNRMAGYLIGRGKTPKEALNEVKMVVEGIVSARAAKGLGEKFNVELPIIDEVNRVLFEGKDVKEAVLSLMTRDRKKENENFTWDSF